MPLEDRGNGDLTCNFHRLERTVGDEPCARGERDDNSLIAISFSSAFTSFYVSPFKFILDKCYVYREVIVSFFLENFIVETWSRRT